MKSIDHLRDAGATLTILAIILCACALSACSSAGTDATPVDQRAVSETSLNRLGINTSSLWLGDYHDGDDLVIVPSEHWRDYSYEFRNTCYTQGFNEPTGAMPIRIEVDAQAEDAAGEYWIGLNNYTQNSREWLGPFTAGHVEVINTPARHDNYLSHAGILAGQDGYEAYRDWFFLYIMHKEGTVRIRSVTLVSDTSYTPTSPHFVPRDGGGSSEQGNWITWFHVPSPCEEYKANDTTEYEVWRKPLAAPTIARELLATVPAPTATYLDATGAPGQTYVYYVRAVNPTGVSAFCMWPVPVTYPD